MAAQRGRDDPDDDEPLLGNQERVLRDLRHIRRVGERTFLWFRLAVIGGFALALYATFV
jgi:hypothetical protein